MYQKKINTKQLYDTSISRTKNKDAVKTGEFTIEFKKLVPKNSRINLKKIKNTIFSKYFE